MVSQLRKDRFLAVLEHVIYADMPPVSLGFQSFYEICASCNN
jgi:hypothetical protein